MRRLRRSLGPLFARPGVAAVVTLGVAWGLVMHQMGWAQMAHYDQVQAFAKGQTQIDQWHWDTNDKAWVDGHFYSVKSPGMAALSTPAFKAIEALGGDKLARAAVNNAEQTAHPKWTPDAVVPLENYGYNVERGVRVQRIVEESTPIVWALTLLAAVIPAILLLLAVRWAADRFVPGYGTAAAITLGLATVVMTFAAEFFSHVISAGFGFAAFCLLMKERDREPSLGLVARAGLLAGLAVTFEFQTGLVGVVLFGYALSRRTGRADARPRMKDWLRRAAVYGAGAVAGALPMLGFNYWAFGDPLKLAYGDAVAFPGVSGHALLGLNSHGFFGITTPRVDSAVSLLLAGRGLLVLTPIIVMAIVGTFMMRKNHRAEANTILAVTAVYFIYNSGYWLPFGGGTPGSPVPDPGPPLPGHRPRLRIQAPPRADARARNPVRADDAGRHTHVSAARQAGRRHLGRLAGAGKARAHRPHRLRRHQRLAGGRSLRGRRAHLCRPRLPGDAVELPLGLPLRGARPAQLGLRVRGRTRDRRRRHQRARPGQQLGALAGRLGAGAVARDPERHPVPRAPDSVSGGPGGT